MLELESGNCAKCGSEALEADFSAKLHGSAKMLLLADLECNDCGFSRQYQNSLT